LPLIIVKGNTKLNTMSKTNKTLIRRLSVLALFLVIIIGSAIVFNKNNKEIDQLYSKNSKLENVLNDRDSLVNEFISAFDTIENSLTFINERRSQLVLENSEGNSTQKDRIIRDIQMMNTMLEESSKEIEDLENKLKNSGIQIRSLKNKIATLNESVKQQNSQIVALQTQIEEQNVQIAKVSSQNNNLQQEVLAFQETVKEKEEIIVQKEEVISQQISELHKGFLAYGTIKELEDNGVVSKQGGFLGLGKNTTLNKNLNEDYFTKIDITENRSIQLNAKKVSLISEHPTDSYRLIEEDGLITKLEIDTPEDFWKISNYAVIEVKL